MRTPRAIQRRWLALFAIAVMLSFLHACHRRLAVSPRPPSSAPPASTVTDTPVCLSPVPTATPTSVFFCDDFSQDLGWTYGTEWERGPAAASAGHTYGYGDPAEDRSATGDNVLAGAVIGGNVTIDLHDFYWLTSPVLDTTGLTNLYLSYWRWYNSDYTEYMEGAMEVWDGSAWVRLFSSGPGPGVTDAAWAFQVFDLTPYLNAALQVRFGHRVGSGGAYISSGWNLDDVMLSYESPPTPVPTSTLTATATYTFTWSATPTFTGHCGSSDMTCTPTDTPTDTPTPTETYTPTLTPTCVHPVTILQDALIPNHTPDATHPIVIFTPVIVASQAECELLSPGNAFCAGVYYGANTLIFYQSMLCYNSFYTTDVAENCIGGLTVFADCGYGCPVCCDWPPEFRYTLLPHSDLPLNDVYCHSP